jgi:hypothetical protein
LGPIVPSDALAVWNVGPQQNNFKTQNGSVFLAASSPTPWGTNQGVLAEFTFQVQSGATSQYLWPITISAVETTENGYINHQLSNASASLSARAPVAGSVASTGLHDGQFSLTVSGDTGASYLIEVSGDLEHWDPLVTVLNVSGSTEVSDPDAGKFDHRFYRARPAE